MLYDHEDWYDYEDAPEDDHENWLRPSKLANKYPLPEGWVWKDESDAFWARAETTKDGFLGDFVTISIQQRNGGLFLVSDNLSMRMKVDTLSEAMQFVQQYVLVTGA